MGTWLSTEATERWVKLQQCPWESKDANKVVERHFTSPLRFQRVVQELKNRRF